MASVVHVRGLRELEKAFKLAGPAANRELRRALREVGEPIAHDAEDLAKANIRNIGDKWARMRVGVTQRVVYVAPRERGRASRANRALRRPNLFDLMMGRSMEPALERNLPFVEANVEHALGTVGREWERVA